MKRRQERSEINCKVLLNLLYSCDQNENEKRLLLLDDLLSKAKNLPPAYRLYFSAEALKYFVPDTVSQRFNEKEPSHMMRIPIKAAIITVKKPELIAAKIAFNIDLQEDESRYVNGLRFWETTICGGPDGYDLDVVITMVGSDGNLSCAIACERLVSIYDVNLIVLVGIAAGVKGKVKLGDVVASDIIIDYEKARLEPDGSKKRPVPYSLEPKVARDLEYFDPLRFGWEEFFHSDFDILKKDQAGNVPTLSNTYKPQLESGVILSGEKLIANGSLDNMRRDYHDRIRAAEMEAAGFARVCKEHGVPWIIFRGISDYGDEKKNDLWQSTSALLAATAAKIFLTKGYRW